MIEKRFEIVKGIDYNVNKEAYFIQDTHYGVLKFGSFWKEKFAKEDCKRLNDICELIEELHTSDHMGWERAEKFEKELKQKKIYIKRLEYKVQKFKEENEQLRKYNKQLKERLEKINGGYGHLTHRNGLTANEWLIESQERELKKKNEQISDWIKQHSKDIAKIGEQQATISRLEEENEQLKKRLEHYAKVEAMNGDGKNERL